MGKYSVLKLVVLIGLLAGLSFVSCKRRQSGSGLYSASAREANKFAQMILLRDLSSDEVGQFSNMSASETIDALMKKPEFSNMIADFNLYFLGFKKQDGVFTSTRDGLAIESGYLDMSAALFSAKETFEGREYLSLFDYNHPIPFLPVSDASATSSNGSISSSKQMPNGTSTNYILQGAKVLLDNLRSNLAPIAEELISNQVDNNALCSKIYNFEFGFNQFLQNIAGNSMSKNREAKATAATLFTASKPCKSLTLSSGGGYPNGNPPVAPQAPTIQIDTNLLIQEIKDLKRDLENFNQLIAANKGSLRSVADIQFLDFKVLGKVFRKEHFSDAFWSSYPSSPTNVNRKRAAYILRKYFCDELFPFELAPPAEMVAAKDTQPIAMATNPMAAAEHIKRKHAEDPGCYSCHYKMDPIGALFRDRDTTGRDISDEKMMFTPDGMQIPLRDFQMQQWGKDGRIYAGYIRDPEDKSKNDLVVDETVDPLRGLLNIVRKAPEVHLCLAKRMTQYLIDQEQTFDQDWLQSLSESFGNNGRSSDAFKGMVKKILLSEAFKKKPLLEPSICYDSVNGAPVEAKPGEPSCVIKSTFKSNCASCHSKNNRISFERWETSIGNFRHRRKDGSQYSLKETKQIILDRLKSKDSDSKMPPQKIPDRELKILIDWVSQ